MTSSCPMNNGAMTFKPPSSFAGLNVACEPLFYGVSSSINDAPRLNSDGKIVCMATSAQKQ